MRRVGRRVRSFQHVRRFDARKGQKRGDVGYMTFRDIVRRLHLPRKGDRVEAV
jgi:hypothetical protein